MPNKSDLSARPDLRRSALLGLRVLAVASVLSGAVLFTFHGRSDASTTDGSITFVPGNDGGSTTSPVTSGNSATQFGVYLQPTPGASDKNANCSADSATGATNVYSYLIHAGEDPTALNFDQGEPGVHTDSTDTTPVLAFFGAGGEVQTNPGSNDQNTSAGSGEILLPPTLAFAWGPLVDPNYGGVPLSTLLYQDNGTDGSWLAGFACFKHGTTGSVTDYWQTPITFTAAAAGANAAGGPDGFTWAVTASSTPGSTTTSSTSTTSTTVPGGSTTTSSTSVPDSTTTTSSTTVAGSTTSSPTTAGSAGSGNSTTGSSGGSGGGGYSGSSGNSTGASASGSGSSSSGSLAFTGARSRQFASLAIVLMMLGVGLLLFTLVVPGRRSTTASPLG